MPDKTPQKSRRRGAYVIWTGLLMLTLVAMAGLVVDGGLLMSTHRHAHNGADAGAMAAAYCKIRQGTDAEAVAEAVAFVQGADHNQMPKADVRVNIPPASGAYAGLPNYVEVIVTNPRPTYFIHVLPGVSQGTSVQARAVAGYEAVAAGEGVIALNPYEYPGLKITGDGQLKVFGDIYVNSEGGGVDEFGVPVDNGNPREGIKVSNNGAICAENINVVGGVNDPNNFKNIVPGDPSPLDAGSLGIEDPLLYLPTPMVGNGVVATEHGSPQAGSGSLALNKPEGSPNMIVTDPETGAQTMVLHPGIYESIQITGGEVEFKPGIYVLRPAQNTTFTLDITGGDVTADGVMFYNTGSDYQPDGTPDSSDVVNDVTPPLSGVKFGNIKINAGMGFKGINTSQYAYSPPVSSEFDGMLFYNRRASEASMQIEGDAAEGNLVGTLYWKWGEIKLAGQGTYDAQFIVGSMDIAGQGDITINYDGQNVGNAAQVFLVE